MTSRTLVIMRHAKAARPDSIDDFDRPLEMRGRGDAQAAGTWLAREGYVPELVLCSPAARTRMTWHEVAVGLVDAGAAAQATVQYEQPLYESGVNAALGLIRDVADGVETVLL